MNLKLNIEIPDEPVKEEAQNLDESVGLTLPNDKHLDYSKMKSTAND